jgi:hypothetical protein
MECVSSKGETSAIVQSLQLFAWKVHGFAAHREFSRPPRHARPMVCAPAPCRAKERSSIGLR